MLAIEAVSWYGNGRIRRATAAAGMLIDSVPWLVRIRDVMIGASPESLRNIRPDLHFFFKCTFVRLLPSSPKVTCHPEKGPFMPPSHVFSCLVHFSWPAIRYMPEAKPDIA